MVRRFTPSGQVSEDPGRKTSAPRTPRFAGLAPASPRASAAARAASRKRDTACEIKLRRALWELGLRCLVATDGLPGKPDVVFRRAQVAVFCDGDFWHGRDLDERLRKLQRGHNAPYWVAKIRRNAERDRDHDAALRERGWVVLRFWEKDILKDPTAIALLVKVEVDARKRRKR